MRSDALGSSWTTRALSLTPLSMTFVDLEILWTVVDSETRRFSSCLAPSMVDCNFWLVALVTFVAACVAFWETDWMAWLVTDLAVSCVVWSVSETAFCADFVAFDAVFCT